ncbi:MAG TPA: F0F1 ATP synthase subunit B [Chloroflexota bacterium]|jgi:F-type H+-transporting ATPase subunit b|nr:F0F1 ATP synthase subunit B [Chloroflexota bacterium]
MQILETLGINLPSFIWHTVNFLLLLFLLSKLLYRPVLKMLDERAERIRESLERAEQVQAQAERDEQERRAQTDDARRQVQTMLTQATTMAEQVKAEARQAAQEEARRIVERAQTEAAAEREQAMAELRQQVADISILAAERVVRANLDSQANRRIVEEFLTELPARNGGAR